jgi:hypothetical protein
VARRAIRPGPVLHRGRGPGQRALQRAGAPSALGLACERPPENGARGRLHPQPAPELDRTAGPD